MKLPAHYCKPTGVPAWKPPTEKLTCYQCGMRFDETHARTIGNSEYPENRVFCSGACSKKAWDKRGLLR